MTKAQAILATACVALAPCALPLLFVGAALSASDPDTANLVGFIGLGCLAPGGLWGLAVLVVYGLTSLYRHFRDL